MDWQMALITYFSLWWVVIFLFLPLRVKKKEGTDALHYAAAPQFPHLWPKIIATTVVTGVLVYAIHLMIVYEALPLRG
jgi:predicted secreted protein